LWLALVPGVAGAVAAAAELSGADDPGPVTIALWVAAATLAFALPIVLLLADSRQVRRRQTAEAIGETRRHFVTRGRGVTPSSFRRQWYFTGRQRALRELSGWLGGEAPDDYRARVVTGGPGSGKSAVLGRVVTFGNATLRRDVPAGQVPVAAGLVPPVGSVHCAVHARGRTADEVAALIGRELGKPVRTAAELLATPARGAGRRVYGIVVDGVDEAQDPEQLIDDLLEPLAGGAATWRVRLLLGLRTGADRSLLRRCGNHVLEVPLDDPGYFDQADLSEYGRRWLSAQNEPSLSSPYRKRPELAARVAAAVAARAGKSFLIVQLTCVALTALPEATDDSPDQFPDSVGAAMDRYLAVFGDDRRRVRDLLLPLAFAEGAGLSDPDVWAALATALGTARYAGQDVAWLLDERRAVHLLAVAEDVTAGPTYRLFHEALGEHLRASVADRMGVRSAHRLITRTLIDHVPPRADGHGPDWLRAGEYVRKHLATHACAAGQIADLVTDPLFLVATDPDRLIGVLPDHQARPAPQVQVVIDVVHRAGRLLFAADDGERAAYLQMTARKLGADDLADDLARLPPVRWSVPWARWQTITGGAGLIGSGNAYVRRVTVGAGLIVSSFDNSIGVWRLGPGSVVPVRLPEFLRAVRCAAAVPDGVVTLHTDGTMLRHTIVSGDVRPWAPSLGVDRPDYCVPMAYEGRDLLVVAGAGTARLWDPLREQPAGPPARVPPSAQFLDAATVAGRPLLLTDLAGTVQAFDLVTGAARGDPVLAFDDEIVDPDGPVWSGALGEIDGQVVAVLGGCRARPIVRWDLDSGARIAGDLAALDIGTMSLAVGHGLLCAGGADGRLRLWSWPAGQRIGQDLAAHEGGIDTVAMLPLAGRAAVVTGGRDGATRIWWPDSCAAETPDHRAAGFAVGRLLRVRVGGRERLLGATGKELVLLDPADGRTIVTRRAQSWDLARLPGRGAGDVAVGMADGSVHLIEAGSLRTRQRLVVGRPGQIAAVAATPGRVVVLTTTGSLQTWDPGRSRQVHPAVDLGPQVTSVLSINGNAVAPGGQTIAAVDLDTGRPSGWRLADGCPRSSDIWRIATGKIGGRAVAVGVGSSAHVHVWDTDDGVLLVDATLDDGHGMALSDVVVARLHGRAVIVSGGYAGAVAVWDLDGRVGEIIEVGTAIRAIAVVGGDTIVVGGPSGLIAITVSRAVVMTERPRRDLGIRVLRTEQKPG
jgi:WD40 repeat protein